MKDFLAHCKSYYKRDPAWSWLLATVFLFPILPEYVSPFLLFAAFIVFKRQWTKQGKKAKVGTLGKLMMAYMTLALVSTFWSSTKMSTLATAGLWWGMFLIQVMIYNLATTRKRIDRILTYMTAAGAINGIIATIQIITFTMFKYGYIAKSQVLTTPIYKPLDKLVYNKLPFDINTTVWWDSRASGFFSNPNLLATYMMIVYPISIYLFLNTKGKKHKIMYFICNVLISAGISSTLTRAGCVIAIAGWLFMFIILIKQHWKPLIQIFIPTVAIIIPSLLTRYGLIFKGRGAGEEAKKSSAAHLQIWSSLIDHIMHHAKTFIIGVGFGLEETGRILFSEYNLDKPHAHNWVIETWMELGIIGLILFIVIIVWSLGKLLEINANNGKKFTLVFCIFTSMMMYLLFGLTDYIFNSPKQILFIFILMGLTQAVSKVYDKSIIIHDAKSLMEAATREIENATHQQPITHK